MTDMNKQQAKEILDEIERDREVWRKEFIDFVQQNLWTEVSFEEYTLFRAWCNTRGDKYFEDIQEQIYEIEEVKIPLATLQHDSWVLYKNQLGIKDYDIVYELLNAKKDMVFKKLAEEEQGGIA